MSISKAENASRFNNIPYEKLVSVTHAAAIAGLHPQTIYRLIKRNEIKVYGYPKTYRVNIDDVLTDRRSSYNYLGQPTELSMVNERYLAEVNEGENRISAVLDVEAPETGAIGAPKEPIDPAADPSASA